jgi:hypothetical protein
MRLQQDRLFVEMRVEWLRTDEANGRLQDLLCIRHVVFCTVEHTLSSFLFHLRCDVSFFLFGCTCRMVQRWPRGTLFAQRWQHRHSTDDAAAVAASPAQKGAQRSSALTAQCDHATASDTRGVHLAKLCWQRSTALPSTADWSMRAIAAAQVQHAIRGRRTPLVNNKWPRIACL